MSEYNLPLPVITTLSKVYWDGCKENKLFYQHCKDCGEVMIYQEGGTAMFKCPKCAPAGVACASCNPVR